MRNRFIKGLIVLISWCAPAFGQVISPEAYLGFKPGADFHLMSYEQAIGYFETLASQTDRMIVLDMGRTSEGRRMKYGVVSSAENIQELEHYKELNKKLSLVKGIDEEQAKKFAQQGKVIVWIDGGLHGTEVAPAQLLPQLAYDLVTMEDPRTQLIRHEVITLIVFANPDGMTIVSNWYMPNVGTPYEVSPIPWLYHKYAGHDNNRDSFVSNLIETQNMNIATSQVWYPEILYNQHQTAPFPARIWIPPDAEPTNPNIHPIIIRWKNLIGAAMGKAFDEAGQPGAISRVNFDTWYPGYATQVVDGHNTVSILTETQLYRYATPQFVQVRDFPKEHQDLTRGVFYPNPWLGGWWRLSDAIAYNWTACMALLETAAKYRYDLLFDKWRIGKDVIERFASEPPYGWIIPSDQRDPYSTANLINKLLINGIEIYETETDFVHNGIHYPKGSYIIPTSQPFGLFVKNLFENQEYPDLRKYKHLWQGLVDSPQMSREPIPAYDAAGWTLPLQMGVTCHQISKPFEVKSKQVTHVALQSGPLNGKGDDFIFSASDNGSYIAINQMLAAGGKVRRSTAPFSFAGKNYPHGSFLVDATSVRFEKLQDILKNTGAQARRGTVGVNAISVKKPRIGLYKSWVAVMDAGWLAWIFEQFSFPFDTLTNAMIKAGDLNKRYDVIVLPDQPTKSIIEGHKKGTMPPDYVGGIGLDGVDRLKEFVRNGGRLVCNESSCDLVIKHFYFPLRNVLENVKPDSFSNPGSILKMKFDTTHPLASGLEEHGYGFFATGFVFETISDTAKNAPTEKEQTQNKDQKPKPKQTVSPKYIKIEPKAVVSFPDDSLLVSGWILGERLLRDRPTVLEVPYGRGKVVLFGFNVHNRAQAFATMKLLFNAMYY
ncbi:MAG: M14 family zinc carboxypeptidase [candidate division KSB1 bacterium]|nr:M14 family zinc carboxypeptidase [candidate division KSB1 bacterium]